MKTLDHRQTGIASILLRHVKHIAFVTGLFTAASLAHAQPLASESFDYPNGVLRNRNGGKGFSGPWESSRARVENKTAIIPNHLLATRYLDKPQELSHPLYISGTVRIDGPAGVSASAWISCGRMEEGDIAVFGLTNNRPHLRGPGGGKSKAVKYLERVEQPNGTAVRCIIKLEKTKPTELRITLWMDPLEEKQAGATATLTEPMENSVDLERIDLRFWCDDRNLSAAFDDLRVARTWQEAIK